MSSTRLFTYARRGLMKYLLLLIPFVFSNIALAFPEAPFDALENPIQRPSNETLNQINEFDFEGIVKLNNCSGSIIRFAGQPDTSKAYVLTNGHCLGWPMPRPDEVRVDRPTSRRMKVSNSDLRMFNVQAERLVYGTMTGTDAAIYRLRQTFEDIQDLGIQSFTLSPNHPLQNVGMDVVSGYWERGYRCNIKHFVFELREGGWLFDDSIRYTDTGCQVIGGTSGSPILETGTRNVIGVNNTGNMDGRRCSQNNPCEVDEDGNITVQKGASYGQQTYQFYSCLTEDFRIDLNKKGCVLAKP